MKLTADELCSRNPIAAAMLAGTLRVSQAAQQREARIAKPVVVAPARKPARDPAREYRWSSSSVGRQGMSH